MAGRDLGNAGADDEEIEILDGHAVLRKPAQ
jgi:hypothetical protein